MLKKNNFFILALLLMEMTSCSRSVCNNPGNVEIPPFWHSVNEEMSLEDPYCFHWWEAFDDPLLTSFIMDAAHQNRDVLMAGLESKDKLLKTMNDVSAEIAKNYVEFRGLQSRLKILNENIWVSSEILTQSKDLTHRGFFSASQENETRKNLEQLLSQLPLLKFSMEKIVFHLSTLLNYPSQNLFETLCPPQDLQDLTYETPVGYPINLICHDAAVKEARKQYRASRSKQSLYNYQKTVLDTLESAETALSSFTYERDKIRSLENVKNLTLESYLLMQDLKTRGFNADRDQLAAYQAFLSEQDSTIQSKVDFWISYINLYHTLSSPWQCCDCR